MLRRRALPATAVLLTLMASSAASANASGWVTFTWPKAGFAVKLPASPQTKTVAMTAGGTRITERVAAEANSQGLFLIAGAHLSRPIPSGQIATELRSSVYSFAAASGAKLVSDRPTRFRGMRANIAVLTSPHGRSYQLLGFVRDASDEIMVLAPRGTAFSAVTASLRLL